MELRWNSFSEQVSDIAVRIYGQDCKREIVNRIALDGVLRIAPDYVVAIMAAIDTDSQKLRLKINQLNEIKKSYLSDGVYLKGVVVARGEIDAQTKALANKLGIAAVSVSEFAATLFEYERYSKSRRSAPFGSAVDPQSGEIDRISYIPVLYTDRSNKQQYATKDIAKEISAGRVVILLGEYGSGKSRCISEVYAALAAEWGATLDFTFAINFTRMLGDADRRRINKTASPCFKFGRYGYFSR